MADLEQFIGQLLQMVEVDLSIDLSKNKIRDQIHGEWVSAALSIVEQDSRAVTNTEEPLYYGYTGAIENALRFPYY